LEKCSSSSGEEAAATAQQQHLWHGSNIYSAAAISVVASLSWPRSSTSGEQLKKCFCFALGATRAGSFWLLIFSHTFFSHIFFLYFWLLIGLPKGTRKSQSTNVIVSFI